MDDQKIVYTGPVLNLSPKEIKELSIAASEGDAKARETLILAHLKFVHNLALSHSDKGVPYEDLYQEGCYGLLCAIEKYKPYPNASFKTFAWFYVNKYIQKALIEQNPNSPIILSQEYHAFIQNYKRSYHKLEEALKRSPTNEELAGDMNVSTSIVNKIKTSQYGYISLDDKIEAEDSTGELSRTYLDIFSSTPDELRPTEALALDNAYPLEELLHNLLPEQEFYVLCMRIGLTDTGDVITYPQISSTLGITVDSARRTYARAIRMLRIAFGLIPPTNKKRRKKNL